MYSQTTRATAFALRNAGVPAREISLRLGPSIETLRNWFAVADVKPPSTDPRCFICNGEACSSPAEYSYLLGQYLGDGHVVTTQRVPRLTIACCDDYPTIAAEVDDAIATIRGRPPTSVQRVGCSQHVSSWAHWPCVFPQRGPGRKHERSIRLEPWQQEIVGAHPWPLIRGLIHSDGCRCVNRVTAGGRTYEYPRYFFSNRSTDIINIFTGALERVGATWRMNQPWSVSIARRRSVALLDEHVGPKS